MNPPTPTPTPARYDRFDLAGDFADLTTDQPPTRVDTPAVGDHHARETADAVIALGRLALRFGRVDRITYHDDGVTAESDTDHTVMLGLIACAFAAAHLPDLDVGLIAEFAPVHDLVEVYAGDTPPCTRCRAPRRPASASASTRPPSASRRSSMPRCPGWPTGSRATRPWSVRRPATSRRSTSSSPRSRTS